MDFETPEDSQAEQPAETHERTAREKLNSGNMAEISEVFDARIDRFQESDLAPDSNGQTFNRIEEKTWSIFPERDGHITDLKAGVSKHLCGVSD